MNFKNKITEDQYFQLEKIKNSIVRKDFRQYATVFLYASMSLRDIYQECSLEITRILNMEKFKDKPFDEIKKIVGKAIEYKLSILRRSVFKKFDIIKRNLIPESKEEYSLDSGIILTEDLRKICSNKHFRVLYGRIALNKTYEELAKEFNCSFQAVQQLFNRAFKKIQKKLIKST